VLASDGKKMSKRLMNYPDPTHMCNIYGADAVRLYMSSSPVVRAEPLKFQEAGVKDIVKDVFLPWYNVYRFLVQETTRYEAEHGKFVPDPSRIKKSKNLMDKWINASMHNLIKFVRDEMDAYRLYTVVGGLTKLLEDLTNWYVRLNRDRMRGANGPEETLTALCTLYDVMLNLVVLLAPLTPFITELLYKNLSRALPDGHAMKAKSVHFVMVPEYDAASLDPDIQRAVERMQGLVELGRLAREQRQVTGKRPLKTMTVINKDKGFIADLKTLQEYVKEEINVMEVVYKDGSDGSGSVTVTLAATLNFKMLGKKLGKDMKTVQSAVPKLTQEELAGFEKDGKMTICGYEITAEEMTLSRGVAKLQDDNLHTVNDSDTMLILDFSPDEDLNRIYIGREVVNRVQKLRKEAKLKPDDLVDMWADAVTNGKQGAKSKLAEALSTKKAFIEEKLRRRLFSESQRQGHELVVKQEVFDIEGEKLQVTITSRSPFFNDAELKKLTNGDATADFCCRNYVNTFEMEKLTQRCKAGSLEVVCEGKTYKLENKKHFSLGPAEASWLS